ncbi:MAG TPA: Asp-tRNA(Asn)/Glu-tRNA(Gln) amidotransferase subunit GatA [Chloroflexota bacterium]|nr:Asp-tRNA(Asn)/Glu-tRNA(Gln) amidotransferase subunit GatA [Chloroflexota bacterium]
MAELTALSIRELRDRLQRREVSALDVARAHLDRIEALDHQTIRSLLTVTRETAEAQARRADDRIAAGEVSPLLGVPMILKDVLITRGIRTTAGSKILENFIPIEDGTITRRLAEAGTTLLGKANMDEFAMGSSTENSAFYPTRNPWDLERVPGGSSGGSAASVGAELAPFSLGTDTGGSIRQPAALCGVVGFKPTYGRVSRYGLIAFASSLDQIGPFTRTVDDAALVMNAIAGHDPCDSTSLNTPVPDYTAALGREPSLKGIRLALPREYFSVEGMEPAVEASVKAGIKHLESLGAELGEVSLPHTQYGLATYYLIAPAEASANLARYDGIKYSSSLREQGDSLWDIYERTRGQLFGREVKRRIVLGTYALSSGYYDAYYLKAQKVRTLIKQDFDKVFETFDAVVGPTSPNVAFPLGAKTQDPLAMYLNDLFTIPTSLAGLPGISVPAGMVGGLPVGLQIIGKALDEATVLRIAHAFEQSTSWHTLRSPLAQRTT